MSSLVSVIIPTYQHAKTIGACIDSILAQKYPHIEIIVVDDGSTDETQEVLKKYKDRIRFITQENSGANPARNRGWKEAKGEYLIFCDADVRMKRGMIKKMVGMLVAHPEASYAYSAFRFGWKTFRGVSFRADKLIDRNFIHTTSLIRAKDFPGFDESVKRLQDWDVWLTMLEAGKTGILVPNTLFTVQVSGVSRIGSSWMPSFVYRIPWRWLPWKPQTISRYESARQAVLEKHNLL